MERLDRVVDQLLSRRRYRQAVPYLAFWGWAELVGAPLARHTRPWKVSGHTLVVAATNGPWAQELFMLRPLLLERLAKRLGRGILTEVQIVARSELPRAEDPTETWPELRSEPVSARPLAPEAARELDQLLRVLVEQGGAGAAAGAEGTAGE